MSHLNESSSLVPESDQTVGIFEDIPRDVFEILELAFDCVLTSISAVVGMMCTALNIFILSSSNVTTDSSNILLMSLSWADFLFCLTVLISRITCIMTHTLDSRTAENVDLNVFQLCSVLSSMFYTTSITMGSVIAVERSIVVFFPLRTASLITSFRVKTVSVAIYVINFALFSPAMFCFGREFVYDEKRSALSVTLTPTEFYLKNHDAIKFVVSVVYSGILGGSSMFLTLCLTPALAIKLWLFLNERSALTHRTHRMDPLLVKIIVTLCAVNLVFYGPFVFFDTIMYNVPNYNVMAYSYLTYLLLADFSGALCATFNFVVYVTMSPKFKKKIQKFV